MQLLNLFARNDDVLEEMLEDSFFTDKSQELLNSLLNPLTVKDAPKEDDFEIVKFDLEFLRKLVYCPKGANFVLSKPLS